ncbi:hypothetical protein OK016_00915 [Vibrio chagasii]|nr:hypothetical protein [Vibrio chagasii]
MKSGDIRYVPTKTEVLSNPRLRWKPTLFPIQFRGQDYTDKDGDTVLLTSDWTSTDIAFISKRAFTPQFKPDSGYAGEVFDVSFSSLRAAHY